jgi:hypothetical protein
MVLQSCNGHKNKLYMVLQSCNSHHNFFNYGVNINTINKLKLLQWPFLLTYRH